MPSGRRAEVRLLAFYLQGMSWNALDHWISKNFTAMQVPESSGDFSLFLCRACDSAKVSSTSCSEIHSASATWQSDDCLINYVIESRHLLESWGKSTNVLLPPLYDGELLLISLFSGDGEVRVHKIHTPSWSSSLKIYPFTHPPNTQMYSSAPAIPSIHTLFFS